MDTATLALSAFSLINAIGQISHEVQVNKKSALSLAQRCQALSPVLQTLPQPQPQPHAHAPTQVRSSFQRQPVSAANLQRMVQL
jgi:hypothetical protein